MILRKRLTVGLLTCVLVLCTTILLAEEKGSILVFAAASTTNVLREMADEFENVSGITVVTSFAASSTLARQIGQGAPADVYLSANLKWMDYLEQKDLIIPTSKKVLFSNSLVLISPLEHQFKKEINRTLDLVSLLGDRYLAIANPDHTPVGIYARQSLEYLGMWKQLSNRIARMKDVRSALMLVERNEAPLGIVYKTDALISRKINIVGQFPVNSHSPIVYLCALVTGSKHDNAGDFLAFMMSKQSKAIIKKHNFESGIR